ncbi:hypothetical protein [Tsukamurella strandjordii]|uniref:hypothetical protein n=1 Tax=Tsukamurella strandjordii TaxID=147577 RepID=UPI0031E0A000
MARDRVELGLPSGRGLSVIGFLLLFIGAIQAMRSDWPSAAAFLGGALVMISGDLDAETARRTARWLGVGLLAASAISYALIRQWYSVGMMAWSVAVLTPTLIAQRGLRSSVIPSESLVGMTVAEAMSRIGFDDDRAPHGLEEPTLVAVPDADVDPLSPSLIVTGVVVDDHEGAMTFGVAEPDRIPAEFDRNDLQRRLVEQVGGTPADILPLQVPDRLSKYRPRLM